jgi:hypothetical protein
MPPTLKATTYRTMYAFKNHIHVCSAEKHLTTNDNCVVDIFEQECISRPNDLKPIFVNLEYVRWVDKILELNSNVLNIVVLFNNWVKIIYVGSSVTIERDEYNYTFVNFNSLIPISNTSFVFPIHIEQVFFSKDPKEKG